jgi:hypothetical protein
MRRISISIVDFVWSRVESEDAVIASILALLMSFSIYLLSVTFNSRFASDDPDQSRIEDVSCFIFEFPKYLIISLFFIDLLHLIMYEDNVAEWLRRWIANPLLFERESSNLSVVVFFFYFFSE